MEPSTTTVAIDFPTWSVDLEEITACVLVMTGLSIEEVFGIVRVLMR